MHDLPNCPDDWRVLFCNECLYSVTIDLDAVIAVWPFEINIGEAMIHNCKDGLYVQEPERCLFCGIRHSRTCIEYQASLSKEQKRVCLYGGWCTSGCSRGLTVQDETCGRQ